MMKENVLDVLMYLFENYLDDDDNETEADRETLTVELEEAGFAKLEINKAFDWLENLARNPPDSEPPITQRDALRVYAAQELEKLTVECRGFLQYLENIGILEAGAARSGHRPHHGAGQRRDRPGTGEVDHPDGAVQPPRPGRCLRAHGRTGVRRLAGRDALTCAGHVNMPRRRRRRKAPAGGLF